jgi:hypothetical protein
VFLIGIVYFSLHKGRRPKHYLVVYEEHGHQSQFSACGKPSVEKTRSGFYVTFKDASQSDVYLFTTQVSLVADGADDLCK